MAEIGAHDGTFIHLHDPGTNTATGGEEENPAG
jgi:hypothetical protein